MVIPIRFRWLIVLFLLIVMTSMTAASDPWKDADGLFKAGKHKEAADAFSVLIRQYPDDMRGYLGRARALLKLRDLDAAMRDCDKAVTLDPKNSFGYNLRALVLQKKGKWDQTIPDLNRAIELSPKDPMIYYNRALSWSALKEYDKAMSDFSKAIELKPKFADAYANRAYVQIQQGHYDEGLEDCQKAIELDDRNAKAYYNRAVVYDYMGEDDKVLPDFDKAIQLNPNDADYYNNRGFFLMNKGKNDAAISNFTKAIELDPKTSKYYNNRGFAWMNKDDMTKAMADYGKALELDPKPAKVFRNRAMAWLILGNDEKAIQDATKSIELNREEAKSFRIRSEARQALGENDSAKEDAWQALILGPQPSMGWSAPVSTEILAREESALKSFLDKDTPQNRSQLAAVRHDHAFAILNNSKRPPNQEWLEEAMAYVQSAHELEPENADHMFLIGLLYQELSKKDERARVMAEQSFRQTVDMDPDYAAAWLELGLLMMSEERGREAMTALEQALANDPFKNAMEVTGPLTAMYALNDEGFRGLDFFRDLYARNPEVPALGIGAAIMLDHVGDREQAIEQARDIMIAEQPGSPVYDYAAKLVAEWEGVKS